MIVDKYVTKGAIYFLPDLINRESLGNNYSHQYIIMSTADSHVIGNRQGYVQCMVITSMRNAPVKWEVPIIGNDGTISYIVPYNLFSFDPLMFTGNLFRGYLQNTDWGSTSEFSQMLMELYCMVRMCGIVDRKKVKKKYKKYVKWFFETYTDAEYHRDISTTRFQTGDMYQKPEVTPALLEKAYKLSDLSHKGDEDDDYIDDSPKKSEMTPVSIRVKKNMKNNMSIEERLYEDMLIQKEAEESPEISDDADDEEDEVYYTSSDGDVGSNIGQIVIPDEIANAVHDDDDIEMKEFKAKMRHQHGQKISVWSDYDLKMFLQMLDTDGVDEAASLFKCTLSNIYAKRKAVKDEITRRNQN